MAPPFPHSTFLSPGQSFHPAVMSWHGPPLPPLHFPIPWSVFPPCSDVHPWPTTPTDGPASTPVWIALSQSPATARDSVQCKAQWPLPLPFSTSETSVGFSIGSGH